MILPPVSEVVRNHASTVNVFGACTCVAVAPKPDDVPLKPDAASESPWMPPPWLRVTPAPRFRSLPPRSEYAWVPEASPSGQWSVAPSVWTALTYGRLLALPAATVALTQAVRTVLLNG